MNGAIVGNWNITSQGKHEFRYDEKWLAHELTRPISLSMPLQPPDVPYKGEVVESWFDNLLPDSETIRKRIQARFGNASSSVFDLLSEVGRDCVGAIQILPSDQEPKNIYSIEGRPLPESDIADRLRATVSTPVLGQKNEDEFRISIAGAQEKTAFLLHKGKWHIPVNATPTTHIFKLPLSRVGTAQIDLSTSIENEWLCLQILEAFGLETAKSKLMQFEDQRVLVVERFDRALAEDSKWWMRILQEDFCQVTGTPPGNKYEADGGPGMETIMSVLMGSQNAQTDRRIFFKSQIISWMLCAIDSHAKNFSIFIKPQGRFTLTPLYDVISAYPILGHRKNQLAQEKAKMAMAVTGKNHHYHWSKISRHHWELTAELCNFKSDINTLIEELVVQTPKVIDDISKRLPNKFPATVSDPILNGLKKACDKLS
ncbi:MAG: type II toxin-antitoxin system HipA family toxin [Gammaproteobacteria bacterium]|nr:type II toxin-antitoxin system HipA family toxin [Gammaproteobacteria bacterium]